MPLMPLVSLRQEANSAARHMPCYAAWKSDMLPPALDKATRVSDHLEHRG